MNPWILERNCSLLPGRPDVIVNHSRSERDAVTPAPADAVSIALVKRLRGIISRSSHVATGQVAQSCPPNWLNSWPRSTGVGRVSGLVRPDQTFQTGRVAHGNLVPSGSKRRNSGRDPGFPESPGPTPQAGFPPPGLSCFGPFGAAEKRNTKIRNGGRGFRRRFAQQFQDEWKPRATPTFHHPHCSPVLLLSSGFPPRRFARAVES